MQKIRPCLSFDTQALEAAKFYTSVFKNSKILKIAYYDKSVAQATGRTQGSVLTVTFRIEGQEFMALNGGPGDKFNAAISLMVDCKTQADVDRLWKKLTSGGGKEIQCGWLVDKYGISWQIVPTILEKMRHVKNKKRSENVMKAMMTMKKMDIKALKQAYKEA